MSLEEIIGLQGPISQLFFSAGTLMLGTSSFLVLALWFPCMLGRTMVAWVRLLGKTSVPLLPAFAHPLLDQIVYPASSGPSPAFAAFTAANGTAGEVKQCFLPVQGIAWCFPALPLHSWRPADWLDSSA